MPHFTYLIPADEVYPGKTISFLPDGTVQQIRPAASTMVYAERHEFNDFEEMCDALFQMSEVRHGYLVRGEVAPDYVGKRRAFRRKLGVMGDGSVLWRYDPRWLCLDIDGLPRPEHVDPLLRPEEAIAYILSTLPPYFNGVSCWWQFSSTESLPANRGMLKCHLFYMLTNPVKEKTLKDWAVSNKKHYFDPSVMQSNQPIYIAPPNIRGGVDWLPVRNGKFIGEVDQLNLNLFTLRTVDRHSNIVPIDQKKIIAKYMQRAGDGEDRIGFNEPIKSAIAAVVGKAGPGIDQEELKKDVRDAIRASPAFEHRTGRPKDEYLDDAYLDPLIKSIIDKESEAKKVTYNQYDAIRSRFVYITNINRFYDRISGNYVTKEALNMTLAKVGRSVADVLVGDPDFVIVDQLTYYPGKEILCNETSIDTGEMAYCFNIYRAPVIVSAPSEGAIFFIEHVRKLAGDDVVFKYMMDWMAHNVQKPGVKIMYAMLIQGRQGTGKSALMEAMKGCLGVQNVRAVETHELLGNFTSWMKGKCLSVVEEIKDSNDRFAIYNRLKPVITAPTITLNEKNVAQVEMRNRMNVMAFTNYETAVPMDDDDRRFFVHFSPMQPEPQEYYDRLFDVIYKQPGAIRQAFLEWDVSNFNPNGRAPMTTSKEFLREYAGPPITRMLREAITNQDWPCKYDLIIVRDFMDVMSPRMKASETIVTVALRGLGAVSIGQHRINGKKATVWCIRNHRDWEFAPSAKINEHYKQPFVDTMNKIEGYIGEGVNVGKSVPEF